MFLCVAVGWTRGCVLGTRRGVLFVLCGWMDALSAGDSEGPSSPLRKKMFVHFFRGWFTPRALHHVKKQGFLFSATEDVVERERFPWLLRREMVVFARLLSRGRRPRRRYG